MPARSRLIDLPIRLRWWLLAAAAVIAGVCLPAAGRLEFDRSIENMFAGDDPYLEPYHKLKQLFGGNEIVLAVYEDPQLLAPDGGGVRRLAEIVQRIKRAQQAGRLPALKAVMSLADLELIVADPAGFVGLRWDAESPARRPTGKVIAGKGNIARTFRDLFAGYTHSEQGDVAAIVCMLRSGASTTERDRTVLELREIIRELPGDLGDGMIAGEPVMIVDGFRYVTQDGRRLAIYSSGLLAIVILLLFRSLRWMIVPLAVVHFAVLVTKAILVLSGSELSMVSSMLTSLITVTGVAAVVHVLVHFRSLREEGLPPRRALTLTWRRLAGPVLLTCITDAVGFSALLLARVGPVRDFGVMLSIGSLLVFVGLVLVLPGLALAGPVDRRPARAWGEGLLTRLLDRSANLVQQKPAWIGGGFVLVAAVLAVGSLRMRVETDFTKNFLPGSPIVESYDFVETRLGGAGVWDVILPAPKKVDSEYLERVAALSDDLRAIGGRADGTGGGASREPDKDTPVEPGGGDSGKADSNNSSARLSKVMSLADADRAAGAIPFAKLLPPATRLGLMRKRMPEFFDALKTTQPDAEGRYWFRIMLRAAERQSAEGKLQLIRRVEEIATSENHFPPGDSQPGAQVTGFFVLLARLIQSMLQDQWLTFAAAAGGIALVILLAFRSPVMGIAALAANGLPILMVTGAMGWSGLPINMGAVMIAAVSMGLSVDSTIHYLSAYRRQRAAGADPATALRHTQLTVGRAMVFSTIALVSGFLVLCASQFVPTIYFGALASLTMAGGAVGNLLLLPLILGLAHGRQS